MPPTCVAVVGLSGTGKTEFLRVAGTLDHATLEWSDVISQLVRFPANSADAFAAACELTRNRGTDYVPALIGRALARTGSRIHVVSGARNRDELRSLLAMYQSRRVVWLHSDFALRLERVRRRSRPDDEVSIEGILRRDFREIAGGLAMIAADEMPDILANDCGLEAFEARVVRYLRAIEETEIDN